MDDLGKKIAHFRKEKGYTVKELARNLCDESTLYRLEQGKQIPRIEILNDICLKLEIPFKALFPLNETLDRLKQLCREFIYLEDYLSLEITLDECRNFMEEISSIYVKLEFRKFIQWHKAVMLQKKEGESQNALKQLNDLVNINNCASELDLNILNSIGLIHLTLNNVDAAYKIYKVIYLKIKKHKIVEDLTILPRIGYNYAHTLYEMENYDKALEVTTYVLHYLETHQLMYSLGKVFHMKGLLSQKWGYINEAVEDFQNAILVFTLTKENSNLLRAKDDLVDLNDNSFLGFGSLDGGLLDRD